METISVYGIRKTEPWDSDNNHMVNIVLAQYQDICPWALRHMQNMLNKLCSEKVLVFDDTYVLQCLMPNQTIDFAFDINAVEEDLIKVTIGVGITNVFSIPSLTVVFNSAFPDLHDVLCDMIVRFANSVIRVNVIVVHIPPIQCNIQDSLGLSVNVDFKCCGLCAREGMQLMSTPRLTIIVDDLKHTIIPKIISTRQDKPVIILRTKRQLHTFWKRHCERWKNNPGEVFPKHVVLVIRHLQLQDPVFREFMVDDSISKYLFLTHKMLQIQGSNKWEELGLPTQPDVVLIACGYFAKQLANQTPKSMTMRYIYQPLLSSSVDWNVLYSLRNKCNKYKHDNAFVCITSGGCSITKLVESNFQNVV